MYQFLATAGNPTSQDLEVASILAIGVGLVLLICFVLLIKIGLLWLTYDAANAADPDKQTMKPGFVWLLLIPLFNYYWNFIALPAISDSLSATARGKDKDVGDAGRSVGMVACYLSLVSFILQLVKEFTKNSSSASLTDGVWSLACLITFICFIAYVVKVRKAKRIINS
mgnify:CR=1 FL=1